MKCPPQISAQYPMLWRTFSPTSTTWICSTCRYPRTLEGSKCGNCRSSRPPVLYSLPEGVSKKECEHKLKLSATLLVYSCRKLLREKGVRSTPAHILHLVWPARLNSVWVGAVLEATRIGYTGMREDNPLTMDTPAGDLAIYMGRERTSITTVRLPKDLKKWVREYCSEHDISFTKLIIHLLTELRRQRGGEVRVEDI